MGDFANWIGRCEVATDVAAADRIADLMALLDDPGSLPNTLPPLGHWLLFRPRVRQSAIATDGHPARDDRSLLPPIPLPRRMWASSVVDFLRPIPLDVSLERRTTVADIVEKQGRSGPMVFVTLEHEVSHAGAPAIRERQQIVYRAAVYSAAPRPASSGGSENGPIVGRYTADPVALFRYSALTGNAHRIHYDRDYARTEGYSGLVVQGPLAATLLLTLYRRHHPAAPITRFGFRAQAPLFEGAPFAFTMRDRRLSIVDEHGTVAMTAEVAA